MLKIILGIENVENYLSEKQLKNLVDFPNKRFDRVKKPEWFKDPMVREIIDKIDNSRVEMDFSMVNNITNIGYSANDLCGGTKSLILIKMLTDKIILANMGDNCVEFLERIAKEYEDRGQDLLIVSNYLHAFKFKHIKEIYYYNFDITCRSEEDVCNKIVPLWIELETRK